MEKKEVIELVKHRNSLLKELDAEMKALEVAESDQLHTVGREVHVKRMKDIRQELRNIELYFRTIGTFDAKEFTKFMTKFLTLTKGEIYTRTVKKALAPGKALGNDNYYIVHPKSDQRLLDELLLTDEDLRRYIKEVRIPSSFVVQGNTVFPFKSNATMKKEFGKDYRLKYAIYELMQLKVDHPEYSDADRYNIVLENTRRRNETTYNGGQK